MPIFAHSNMKKISQILRKSIIAFLVSSVFIETFASYFSNFSQTEVNKFVYQSLLSDGNSAILSPSNFENKIENFKSAENSNQFQFKSPTKSNLLAELANFIKCKYEILLALDSSLLLNQVFSSYSNLRSPPTFKS